MVIKEESGLKFGFPDGDSVVKFDDTKFYRNSFNALPESKGVDFISTGQDAISFIEVKNCLGDEGNNRWRIAPDNQKHDTTATNNDVTGRDSFDIEVSQKVAMTLAALSGARSFGDRKDSFEELQNSVTAVFSEKFTMDRMKKYVILFLEGDFGYKSNSKNMIMEKLQRSIRKKMRWLDCKVSVVDSDTYDKKIFMIVS